MFGIHNKNKVRNLRLFFPIVFYHGKQKWKKQKFEDYFGKTDAKIKKFLPIFDYELVDISVLSDEEIFNLYQNIELRTSLLLLKNIFDKHFVSKIAVIFTDVDKLLNNELGERFIETISAYVFYNNIDVNFQKIIEQMKTVAPKSGEKFVSIATSLLRRGRREGLKEGWSEGRKEGRKDTALKMLQKGYDDNSIIELTGLTTEELAELKKQETDITFDDIFDEEN